jgi:DNA-binding NarL/FixJ family response regulator
MFDKIRVLLAEDQSPDVNYILSIISSESDMAVVGKNTNTDKNMPGLAKQLNSDNILIDLGVLGRNCVGIADNLRGIASEIKVLLLADHDDIAFISAMIKTGAMGCLFRHATDKELTSAICTTLGGEFVLGSNIANVVYFQIRLLQPCIHSDTLSNREL